ncbi:protein ACCELERATED CELL DEATH 6-like [Solanum lycopersicum]|uniref:PGG domain-containing protein n=1 Tax=Solanum lycopersicum TaxID=4081 RepID=A0A3Q7HHT7_SOLLC
MDLDEDDTRRVKEIMKAAQIHLVVATLLVTVTFAAGFTLPGGFENDHDSPHTGMAILVKKPAFCAFVVTDAIAFVGSAGAVFSYFVMAANHRPKTKEELRVLKNIYKVATILQFLAMSAVVIAFVTGLYATLSHSVSLATSVCAIGCLSFIIYVLVLLLIYKGLTGETTNQ